MIVISFLLGLFFGSFLLAVIDRYGKKESFVTGRSKCDYCHTELRWYDLIPVVSYLITRGTCRYCHMTLSPLYLVFELLTAFLFALTTYSLVGTVTIVPLVTLFSLLFALYITCVLLLIFFIDLKYGIIPFKIMFPAIISTLAYALLTDPSTLVLSLLAGCGAFSLFLLLFFITKGRGMGFGDVVYVIFMGTLLSWPSIVVGMYIAFLSGAVLSLIFVWFKKKKLRGSTIPFGPFLVLGTYIAWIWGEKISRFVIQWMLQL